MTNLREYENPLAHKADNIRPLPVAQADGLTKAILDITRGRDRWVNYWLNYDGDTAKHVSERDFGSREEAIRNVHRHSHKGLWESDRSEFRQRYLHTLRFGADGTISAHNLAAVTEPEART